MSEDSCAPNETLGAVGDGQGVGDSEKEEIILDVNLTKDVTGFGDTCPKPKESPKRKSPRKRNRSKEAKIRIENLDQDGITSNGSSWEDMIEGCSESAACPNQEVEDENGNLPVNAEDETLRQTIRETISAFKAQNPEDTEFLGMEVNTILEKSLDKIAQLMNRGDEEPETASREPSKDNVEAAERLFRNCSEEKVESVESASSTESVETVSRKSSHAKLDTVSPNFSNDNLETISRQSSNARLEAASRNRSTENLDSVSRKISNENLENAEIPTPALVLNEQIEESLEDVITNDNEQRPLGKAVHFNEHPPDVQIIEEPPSEVRVFELHLEDSKMTSENTEDQDAEAEATDHAKETIILVENVVHSESITSSVASMESAGSLLRGNGSSCEEMTAASPESFHYPSRETVDGNENTGSSNEGATETSCETINIFKANNSEGCQPLGDEMNSILAKSLEKIAQRMKMAEEEDAPETASVQMDENVEHSSCPFSSDNFEQVMNVTMPGGLEPVSRIRSNENVAPVSRILSQENVEAISQVQNCDESLEPAVRPSSGQNVETVAETSSNELAMEPETLVPSADNFEPVNVIPADTNSEPMTLIPSDENVEPLSRIRSNENLEPVARIRSKENVAHVFRKRSKEDIKAVFRVGSNESVQTVSRKSSNANLEPVSCSLSNENVEIVSCKTSVENVETASRKSSNEKVENVSRKSSIENVKNASRKSSNENVGIVSRKSSTENVETVSRKSSNENVECASRRRSKENLEAASGIGANDNLESDPRNISDEKIESLKISPPLSVSNEQAQEQEDDATNNNTSNSLISEQRSSAKAVHFNEHPPDVQIIEEPASEVRVFELHLDDSKVTSESSKDPNARTEDHAKETIILVENIVQSESITSSVASMGSAGSLLRGNGSSCEEMIAACPEPFHYPSQELADEYETAVVNTEGVTETSQSGIGQTCENEDSILDYMKTLVTSGQELKRADDEQKQSKTVSTQVEENDEPGSYDLSIANFESVTHISPAENLQAVSRIRSRDDLEPVSRIRSRESVEAVSQIISCESVELEPEGEAHSGESMEDVCRLSTSESVEPAARFSSNENMGAVHEINPNDFLIDSRNMTFIRSESEENLEPISKIPPDDFYPEEIEEEEESISFPRPAKEPEIIFEMEVPSPPAEFMDTETESDCPWLPERVESLTKVIAEKEKRDEAAVDAIKKASGPLPDINANIGRMDKRGTPKRGSSHNQREDAENEKEGCTCAKMCSIM